MTTFDEAITVMLQQSEREEALKMARRERYIMESRDFGPLTAEEVSFFFGPDSPLNALYAELHSVSHALQPVLR